MRAIPGTAAVGIGPLDYALAWAHSSRLGDIIGYLASALVLATFSMRSMRPLRLMAIASNIAFIAYAVIGNMPPILMLHSILLPMNIMRLFQMDHDTAHRDAGFFADSVACRSGADAPRSSVAEG